MSYNIIEIIRDSVTKKFANEESCQKNSDYDTILKHFSNDKQFNAISEPYINQINKLLDECIEKVSQNYK